MRAAMDLVGKLASPPLASASDSLTGASSPAASPRAAPSLGLSTSATEAPRLDGQRVMISGLQTKPRLNGAFGQVICFDEVRGRYVVVLDQQGGPEGNMLVKPEHLVTAIGEPVWRAEDSFYHAGQARVTPVVEASNAAAISVTGTEVRLVGPSATVRPTRARTRSLRS